MSEQPERGKHNEEAWLAGGKSVGLATRFQDVAERQTSHVEDTEFSSAWISCRMLSIDCLTVWWHVCIEKKDGALRGETFLCC